jgi:hypothetical protein
MLTKVLYQLHCQFVRPTCTSLWYFYGTNSVQSKLQLSWNANKTTGHACVILHCMRFHHTRSSMLQFIPLIWLCSCNSFIQFNVNKPLNKQLNNVPYTFILISCNSMVTLFELNEWIAWAIECTWVASFRPKYFPQHPILKHPQPTFVPQCQRPSSTPIQNNGQNYNSNLY